MLWSAFCSQPFSGCGCEGSEGRWVLVLLWEDVFFTNKHLVISVLWGIIDNTVNQGLLL